MRVVMRSTTPWRHTSVPVLVGIALEVALMLGLGMIGATGVLGLPGPLAVAIASVVGIVAGPRYAVVVAAAGCVAYLAFLSEFGRQVPYTVVAVSSLLWIGMPWLIARARLPACRRHRQVVGTGGRRCREWPRWDTRQRGTARCS